MNYRQWKKKYKKEHGYNPPLSEDKRQQVKALKKANNTMKEWAFPMCDWNRIFKRFNYAMGQFAYQLGESLSAAGQLMMELNKDDT